jgi:hypothetical protein
MGLMRVRVLPTRSTRSLCNSATNHTITATTTNNIVTTMIAILFHTEQHTLILFLVIITCLVLQVSSFTPARKQQTSFFTMSLSSSSSNRIVVVGSANQDLISNSDILPAIGETVMGKDFATACGGKGGNQAVAAALLQMTPVTMICRVGDDLFGQSLLNNFRK